MRCHLRFSQEPPNCLTRQRHPSLKLNIKYKMALKARPGPSGVYQQLGPLGITKEQTTWPRCYCWNSEFVWRNHLHAFAQKCSKSCPRPSQHPNLLAIKPPTRDCEPKHAPEHVDQTQPPMAQCLRTDESNQHSKYFHVFPSVDV